MHTARHTINNSIIASSVLFKSKTFKQKCIPNQNEFPSASVILISNHWTINKPLDISATKELAAIFRPTAFIRAQVRIQVV